MILYIMGVCGSGKSTIGELLAKELNMSFYDGDDFHPKANIDKMSDGIPLNDSDRVGWLKALNSKAKEEKKGIFACSALKQSYRDILFDGLPLNTHLVYLNGSYELIDKRMKARENHFMPADLLNSQFETLEKPDFCIEVSIDQSPANIITDILKKIPKPSQEFGLVGLGVMGKSLARNLANNGFNLSLYNRYVAGSEENVAENFILHHSELSQAKGFEDMREFVQSLQSPRKVFLMVNAGKVTDMVIEELSILMEEGDVIIDGGNSHFENTEKRALSLKGKGIHFIGTGVSGGEEGALKGPSIMPSGDKVAYNKIAPYLEAISAKDKNGKSCCTYVGKGGSGHYVKMVHNGIEYAEMQLIAELYGILRYTNELEPNEISSIFEEWNKGELASYLLEITYKLLKKKENEKYIVDVILDQAGNKGTGSWTTISMAELGIPATMISSALFARYISAFKEKRSEFTNEFNLGIENNEKVKIEDLKKAYQLARLVNHIQGFDLIQEASVKFEWGLNLSEIARIWTNGCIIRSFLMETLVGHLKNTSSLLFTLSKTEMAEQIKALRLITVSSINNGISVPVHLSAVDYLNASLYNHPTANIIQAQRDFFGAHTYKKINDETGKSFHTIWE